MTERDYAIKSFKEITLNAKRHTEQRMDLYYEKIKTLMSDYQDLILENQMVLEELEQECQDKINENMAYCVSHSNDYSATAKEFNCSYGQVYSWVNKYSKKGVDGLKDGRGRNKSADELSELEKLRAENRLLKAEKKRQQIEIDLLKKLEEIERR